MRVSSCISVVGADGEKLGYFVCAMSLYLASTGCSVARYSLVCEQPCYLNIRKLFKSFANRFIIVEICTKKVLLISNRFFNPIGIECG